MLKKAFCLLSFSILMLLPCAGTVSAADSDTKEAIVKIYTRHNSPDYFNPWSMLGPGASTGSGCIIEGKRILTNAHVVSNQTFIQVRRYGSSKRYRAKVQSVSHEADLALLSVDDEELFANVEPLRFGLLPDTQQEVLVYGFPLGGDSLSITKGVVSRIEHLSYAHSSAYLFAAQIDAAINPGNSGGPVLVDDRVVGVVMQSVNVKDAENIGYMVPVNVIKHYMKDLEDRSLDGFPSVGIGFQTMENPDLRAFYGLPAERSGLLVTRVLPQSPAIGHLQVGDVLISVDGHSIADDGTVEFRPGERTNFMYFVQGHQLGEFVEFEVATQGVLRKEKIQLSIPVQKLWLVPMEQYDKMPPYYIFGGLVFTKLTKNLLKRWGSGWYNKAPKHLVAKLIPNFPSEKDEEVVVLLKILATDLTRGYHDYSFWVVDEVDSQKVRNLEDLVRILEEETDKPYLQIVNDNGTKLVLDRNKARAAQKEVLKTYRISESRSAGL